MFLAFFLCLSSLPLPARAETGTPATESTPETTAEPSSEATTEPAALPPTETATEPVTEPATEPITEPSTNPSTEATAEPSTDPSTEVTAEPSAEPTRESTDTTPPTTEELLTETIAPVTIDPIGGQLAPGQTVTLSCATEGASIYYAISYDGETYSDFYQYIQPLLPEADFSCFCVKAYAVKMGLPDGPLTESYFTGTPVPRQSSDGWNFYFGRLHAHSSVFGTMPDLPSPAEAYAQAAENMDFLAITDYSHTFHTTDSQNDWTAGKTAAVEASTDSFLALWGYEMAWPDDLFLGHISAFATENFASRHQEEFTNHPTALENYYAHLCADPSAIGQFNHPSLDYSFENFSHYSPLADQAMNLLEITTESTLEFYNKALKAGWHLAPSWGGGTQPAEMSTGRTVVLAETLTDTSLYNALRSRRAYATADSDLMVDFRLNDSPMGSILSVAAAADITVTLADPTDPEIGTVTVITDGTSATSQTLSANEGTLTFQLPATSEFYYILVEQPDGDFAVTAPIWIHQPEDFGISGLSQDAVLPIQNQPLNITLELYNNETMDFTAESIEFYIGDTKIKSMPAMAVAPGRAEACTFSYTCPDPGLTTIRAVVTTTVNGEKREFSRELDIRFHLPQQISTVLVDTFYSGISAGNLQSLSALAAQSDILVNFPARELTAEDLQRTGLVILPAPKAAYSDAFLHDLSEFLQNGGNLILCGHGSPSDAGFAAAEQNRLLSALHATLRLLPGTVTDEENNGGSKELLYPAVFNKDSSFCAQIDSDQFYCHRSGCAVDPGNGEWLVKGLSTTYWGETPEPVLLAREATSFGGNILLAGSFFLKDTDMPLPENQWDPPTINQSILMSLLKIQSQRQELPLSTIKTVRSGTPGDPYRIRGYVTAGTSKPHNSFPGTLYLQDETGGIAVVPFRESGIPQNAQLEIIGYLDEIQGNTVLYLIDHELIAENGQALDPRTISNKEAMDYKTHGGELLQIEGTAISITYTANKEGVTRFTLKDKNGDLATVLVESYIGAGSSGENNLAEKVLKGKTVRVRGILHMDSTGAPVLRVRNCEEVLYVPPAVTPNTGDPIRGSFTVLLLSSLGLAVLLHKKKTKREGH